MGPGQLSHLRRDNFAPLPVGLEELSHPEEAGAGEALEVRVAFGQVGRQAVHGLFAPGRRLDLGADVSPDLPAKVDVRRVDCDVSPLPGLQDEGSNLSKR